MMKKKTVENFTYHGLGFPIELSQVEMLKINDEWHPKIDVKGVSYLAIRHLISQKGRLTGNQLRFVRVYLSMTLKAFSREIMQQSHMTVSQWEAFGSQIPNMPLNINTLLKYSIKKRLETQAA